MRAPTLAEVLTNQAPPPYTLSAFMAFLSQNHCLETLEFTLDASRYQTYYYSLKQIPPTPGSDEANRLRNSWNRLIASYIKPGAMREVNLTASDRDFLIRIPNTYTPPSPEALDGAVFKITELMRDSVLSPFLQSCQQKLQERSLNANNSHSNGPNAHANPPFPATCARGQSNESWSQGSKRAPEMHFPRARSAPVKVGQNIQNLESQAYPGDLQRQQQQRQIPLQQHNPSGYNSAPSGLSQLFGGHGRKITRPTSARPTSVPASDFPSAMDGCPGDGEDSDMVNADDIMTPPHTPPSGSSPIAGGAQWRSKIKNQLSKINSGRARN